MIVSECIQALTQDLWREHPHKRPCHTVKIVLVQREINSDIV